MFLKITKEKIDKWERKKNIKKLIEILRNEDKTLCKLSVEALGNIGDKSVIEELVDVFLIEDIDIAESTLVALTKLNWIPKNGYEINRCCSVGEKGIEPIIKALNDLNFRRRIEVIEVLKNNGNINAVEILIKTLIDEDFRVRREASWALVEIKDNNVIDILIKALDDIRADVRIKVIEVLGNIGDIKAVEPLIKALEDNDLYVQQAAASALNTLGWKPANDENSVRFFILTGEFDKCVEIGEMAVEPLIKALSNNGDSKLLIEALGQIGDKRAVEPLIDALSKTESLSSNREPLIRALGQIGDERAVEQLIKFLKNNYPVAAIALGLIGNKRAIEALIEVSEDEYSYVRKHAADVLKRIDNPQTFEEYEKKEEAAAEKENAENDKRIKEQDEKIRMIIDNCSEEVAKEILSSFNNDSFIRQIGYALDEEGGLRLMREIHGAVRELGSVSIARELEYKWDNIGDWQA